MKREKIGPGLLLMTNRKLHTLFRLVPKSTTLDDLERQLPILLLSKVFLEPTTKSWMETNPYYHPRDPRFPGVKQRWVVKTSIFSAFWRYIFRTLGNEANIIIYTVSQKYIHHTPVHIFTDFRNSFTGSLSRKFVIKPLLKVFNTP